MNQMGLPALGTMQGSNISNDMTKMSAGEMNSSLDAMGDPSQGQQDPMSMQTPGQAIGQMQNKQQVRPGQAQQGLAASMAMQPGLQMATPLDSMNNTLVGNNSQQVQTQQSFKPTAGLAAGMQGNTYAR